MATAYSFSEISFFIVEENQFVRTLITDLLNQFKPKKIYTESRFSVAIDRIPDIAPDIIFAGWTPFTDSIKLFKAIRSSSNESLSETPIIAVTPYSEKKYVIAARDLGMNEYLTLPLSAKSVYARICHLIEKPRFFIRSEKFCGPDRRVKELPIQGDDRRVASPELEKVE